jgi:hypothetical protein
MAKKKLIDERILLAIADLGWLEGKDDETCVGIYILVNGKIQLYAEMPEKCPVPILIHYGKGVYVYDENDPCNEVFEVG